MTSAHGLDSIRMLCEYIKAGSKIVFFIGAGGSVSAGIPLADELSEKVLAQISTSSEEGPELRGLRLEELMSRIRSQIGKSGYVILASELRQYAEPPVGYKKLMDIASADAVAAIITVNFDELLEKATIGRSTPNTQTISEEEQFGQALVSGVVPIIKLHGTIENELSMLAAWDETDELDPQKPVFVIPFLNDYLVVFVGYAARDKDILKLFSELRKKGRPANIFWVNPSMTPPAEIQEVLNDFASSDNYISLTADEFFSRMHGGLFPRLGQAELPPAALGTKIKRVIESNRAYVQASEKTESLSKREEFRRALESLVASKFSEFAARLSVGDTWQQLVGTLYWEAYDQIAAQVGLDRGLLLPGNFNWVGGGLQVSGHPRHLYAACAPIPRDDNVLFIGVIGVREGDIGKVEKCYSDKIGWLSEADMIKAEELLKTLLEDFTTSIDVWFSR